MKKGITVVTYDSDAPACRTLFINQADSAGIANVEVDGLAKQIGGAGKIAILSAAASATNQNAWIALMKQRLKKYPKMQLVTIVYGNDDPTTRPRSRRASCSSTRTSRASSRPPRSGSPQLPPFSTRPSTGAR